MPDDLRIYRKTNSRIYGLFCGVRMKQISLSNGKAFALVDDADFEWINSTKWYLHSNGYAVGPNGTELMHRVILKPRSGFIPDHIDGNKLNNSRANLREATRGQNAMNSKPREIKHGMRPRKYRGVCWNNRRNKWIAYVNADGKREYLGYFHSENDAALAYNARASLLHNDFARLNEVRA